MTCINIVPPLIIHIKGDSFGYLSNIQAYSDVSAT